MLAGDLVSLWIDLNMVDGDRVMTLRDHVIDSDRLPDLSVGQVVRTVEEEGDAYLAVVDYLAPRGVVYLRLLLDTWQPRIEITNLPEPAPITDEEPVWVTSSKMKLATAA